MLLLSAPTHRVRVAKFASFSDGEGGVYKSVGKCCRQTFNFLACLTINQASIFPALSFRITRCERVVFLRQLAILARTTTSERQQATLVAHKYKSSSSIASWRKFSRHVSFGPVVVQKLLSCDRNLPSSEMMSINISKVISKLMSTVLPPKPSSNCSGVPFEPKSKAPMADPRGIKQMKINACGELYEELSKTKPCLYGNAPKGCGIDFNLSYYDSLELLKPEECEKAPIVCLLHGAPGHFNDFDKTIHFLTTKGVRVVAPNFPSYSATYDHSFRHSPRERVDYLLGFFKAINIRQIDMLVGHSSAVYTIFELLNQILNSKTIANTGNQSECKLIVKSLGLFSTPTYNLPRNMAVTPFRLFTLKLFDYPFLRPIILALIHTFVKFQGIRNRVDTRQIDNLLIAASAVGYSDSEKMQDYIKMVHQFRIPTYVLFGCNDRLIPTRCFEQLKRDLKVTNDGQVRQYDKDGKSVDESDRQAIAASDKLVLVSQYDNGGHYVFQRFSSQVNEDIYGFLEAKVLKNNNGADKKGNPDTTRL